MEIVLDDPFLICRYVDREIVEIHQCSRDTRDICEHSLYDIVVSCISSTLEFFGSRVVCQLVCDRVTRSKSCTLESRDSEVDSSVKCLVPSKCLSRSRDDTRIGRICCLEDQVGS